MSRKQTGMQAGFLLSKTSTTVKQRRTMVRAMNPQKAGTKETGGQQTSGTSDVVQKGGDLHFVPQGSFVGYGSMAYQLPHEVPEGVEAVVFKLKPDVSLEWLLQLADTLQGLPGLEGESFQGLLVRPDVYYWHAVRPDSLHKPWVEACVAAQGCLPAIDYKIEANSKDDADRIEQVLRPRTERLRRFEGDSLRPRIVIND